MGGSLGRKGIAYFGESDGLSKSSVRPGILSQQFIVNRRKCGGDTGETVYVIKNER